MAFKGKRDMMLFTTKRLLIVNVKGWSGKKVNYLSVPWRAIQCFAVETAGSFLDMDAEMKLWTDIFYDPPPPHGENENPPPEPGMSFIEQNFQKVCTHLRFCRPVPPASQEFEWTDASTQGESTRFLPDCPCSKGVG